VPLHTLRADIEYGFSEARTTYGTIGVQVLVFKGEVLGKGEQPATPAPEPEREREPRSERKPRGKPGVRNAAAS
jgi:small subunit ribosomal protein S3